MVEPQVLLRMCAKLLLEGGPQGIANLQLLQGFLRNMLCPAIKLCSCDVINLLLTKRVR